MTDVLGGLGDDIAEQLKEIKNQSTSENDSAMRQVTSEFKTAMTQLSQQLSENARMQNQDGMSGVAALLQELISATKSGVDVQQKILASSY
jgi:Sec-independent protein translocase protein TatA